TRLASRDACKGRLRVGGVRGAGGRAATAPRTHDVGEVQPRGGGGGYDACDVGDRTSRRLLPAAADPRPDARGCKQPDLRRLANDFVWPEDLARERRDADDAGIACLYLMSREGAVASAARDSHFVDCPYAAPVTAPSRTSAFSERPFHRRHQAALERRFMAAPARGVSGGDGASFS